VVTTPQQLSVVDVKKCITFCRQLNVPVLGIVENMSGFVCPHCHQQVDIFKGNGGRQMARDFDLPLLATVPLDPEMVSACDSGRPFIQFNQQSPTAQAISAAFRPLLRPSTRILTDKEVKVQ
jgi:MinD superfamily P-loop ATPase